jgi:hypothetical protein
MMSSAYCLKQISGQVKDAGYDISSVRIREACLSNNFDVSAATNKLICEEQLKVYLGKLCVKMGHNPNKKFILCSCDRFKFQTVKTEQYIIKLLKSRNKVFAKCTKHNIYISNTELDDVVIKAFGNESCAFNSIRMDHSNFQGHRL